MAQAGWTATFSLTTCVVVFLPSCDWIKHSGLPWRRDLDHSRKPGVLGQRAGLGGGVGGEGGMQLRVGPGLASLRLYRLL